MFNANKVLAIYGASNQGKSTTIKNIYNTLLNQGAANLFYQSQGSVDFEAIVNFKRYEQDRY